MAESTPSTRDPRRQLALARTALIFFSVRHGLGIATVLLFAIALPVVGSEPLGLIGIPIALAYAGVAFFYGRKLYRLYRHHRQAVERLSGE